MPSLSGRSPRNILVRSTNWIGDAIMTTPAVRSIRRAFPDARISMLCKPWVADIFASSPFVDEVILYEKESRHRGVGGLLRLAAELEERRFDLAILLQNAFEAALISWLAKIPVRAGYRRDGRGWLLTHGVKIDPEIRKRHQVYYYQGLLQGLGIDPGPDELFLALPSQTEGWARRLLGSRPGRVVVGMNPGAAYGPAKRWPAERYAELAARLVREFDASILVFGTRADQGAAQVIKEASPKRVVDFAGRTSLAEAMALVKCCDCFVTNDSGLMHVAAALNVPQVAVFGSTDEIATGPFSRRAKVVKKPLPCSPCLKPRCRMKDYRCMLEVTVDEVWENVAELIEAFGTDWRETEGPQGGTVAGPRVRP